MLKKYLQDGVFTVGRILFGLMWLEAAGWKNPPYFGRYTGNALYYWLAQGIEYPTLGWFSTLINEFALKNLIVVGWLVVFLELVLGLCFVFGFRVRLAAAIAVTYTLIIMLIVLNIPGEWYWSYIFMLIVSAFLASFYNPNLKLTLDHWYKFWQTNRHHENKTAETS